MEKTAVEWLEQHIKELETKLFNFEVSPLESPTIREGLYKQAKQMEKEQIIDAGNACSIKSMVHREKLDKMSEDELRNSLVEDTISYGEEYYNQTYNQNK